MGFSALNNIIDQCEKEAIHVPGSIQPFGYFLAIESTTSKIVAFSENCSHLFMPDHPSLLGFSLDEVIGEKAAKKVRSLAEKIDQGRASFQTTEFIKPGHESWYFHIHHTDRLVIIELEPALEQKILSKFETQIHLSDIIQEVQGVRSLAELNPLVARLVKLLTGFDRVMVYKFDRDWNGMVIGEAKEEDLKPYLGHHYPASDIPRQARDLYTKNWTRLIYDADYTPSHLIVAEDFGLPHQIDLSHSVLRSVSPVHIQYLKNMGVKSSMSISLMKDQKLWGLIACHHRQPRFMDYERRIICEAIGQIFSWQIAVLTETEEQDQINMANIKLATLSSNLKDYSEILLGAREHALQVRDLLDAQGVMIKFRGQVSRHGQTPPIAFVEELIPLLRERGNNGLYVSSSLGQDLLMTKSYLHEAAGVLAIFFANDLDDMIIWFREENPIVREWAGDPNKAVSIDTDSGALSPRTSFAIWKEVIRGTSLEWSVADVTIARKFMCSLSSSMASHIESFRKKNQKLQEAIQARDDFLAMVSHEMKTPITAILGWSQLLKSKDLPKKKQEEALETIFRCAKNQNLLIDDLLDMSRIITGKMRLNIVNFNLIDAVHDSIETLRLAILGKGISFSLNLVATDLPIIGDRNRLQQVMWNILSNAVKFTPVEGKITFNVSREEASYVLMIQDNGCGIEPTMLQRIFERFQQAYQPNAKFIQGLGLGLAISKQIVELHGGIIWAESEGLGMGTRFYIKLPIASHHHI
ncbi:MAG: ATP-binding protein [Oligoflexus sp.]